MTLNGLPQMFADDIVMKYKADSMLSLFDQMQEDMRTLETWMNQNKLVLNAEKTKMMIFENKRTIFSQQLFYGRQLIEAVKQYKYLGLTITSNFKWDAHVDSIKLKILPYIFAIFRLKNILPQVSLKMIYDSYIHSHLLYLNPIWGGCSSTKLNELFVLQKRAIKNIMNVSWLFPSENLFKTQYRSLNFIINEQLILLIYKIINNKIKHNLITCAN